MPLTQQSADTLDSVIIATEEVKSLRNALFAEGSPDAIPAQDAFDLMNLAQAKLVMIRRNVLEQSK